MFGLQAGADLVGWESASGHQDRLGIFVGWNTMSGDASGQALGWNGLLVGEADLDGTSLGASWTHVAPAGWYLDAVAMATFFNGDATSDSSVGVDVDGTGVTLSLEGGYPIPLTPEWSLEPQAQIIWQDISLDDADDGIAVVTFDADDAVVGRIGARLQGSLDLGGAPLQPYVKANLWHDFGGSYTTGFDGFPIVTEGGGTALEVGGGAIATLSPTVSLFASADYTTDLDGGNVEVLDGNVGLSLRW